MFKFPIGVIADSFRGEIHEGIKKAAALGADGIQIYGTTSTVSPEALNAEKRRELLDFIKSNGLVVSGVIGDCGQIGNKETNAPIIERSKRILDLAKDLECDIVTTHIGVVPEDPSHERYKVMQEACFELSRYADSIGSHFAIETGPETSATLKKFLDALDSTGVAVNLDPANLVMVTGDDPVQAVYNLRRYIVHTHAKDGVMLQRTNPEYIYHITPKPEDLAGIKFFKEVPLGEGSVDFEKYLAALDDIGYRGFLTIEREVGEDPAADIAKAKRHLESIINK